jgi:hypothetical protein
MSGAGSIERTRRWLGAGGSLVAGALATYWLIEILRNRAPDIGARDVKISIALLSILALAFGLVARRPSGRITMGPLLLAPWAAAFAAHLNRPNQYFGALGIVTVVVAFVLLSVALLVREPWRRRAAQPAVAADGAPPRR